MRPIQQLTAGDVMTRAVVSARPQQKLLDVEKLLIEGRISGAPVVDAGKLVGVISRTDIARVQVLMQNLDGQVSDTQHFDDTQADGFQHSERPDFLGFEQRLNILTVRDAMRFQVFTCTPATPISEVAGTMVAQHIHRVIVVENDKPVGVVSSLDLVKLVAQYSSEVV